MKKFWLVTYSGLWLGGKAVVVAETADEAIELVKNDAGTQNFKKATAEEIKPENGVLYNDNGNY